MKVKVNTRSLLWTQIYLLLIVRLISSLISFNPIVYLCDIVTIAIFVIQIKHGLPRQGVVLLFAIEFIYWVISFTMGLSGSISAFIELSRVLVRFYIIFTAAFRVFDEKDYRKIFDIFDIIIVIHTALVFYQTYILHYTNGDMVGGLFGVTFGYGNTASHGLILIGTLVTVYKYFVCSDSVRKSAIKLVMLFSVAMITEMKSFVFEAALIVILFLVLDGRIKARTGLILAVIPVAGIVFLDYMINYFNFNIFDLDSINGYLNRGYGYNIDGVSRHDGYGKVFNRCFGGDWRLTIFGFGFATSVSPFTETYFNNMNLGNFTYAKMFYDVGIVGSILYFAPFIICIFKGFELRKYNKMIGAFCVILGILCVYLNFYGSLLESDFCGYYMYILLALPFILDKRVQAGDYTIDNI